MSTPPDDAARVRLLELSRRSGISLAGLSTMIGRNSSYLQQFIRKGSPRRLEERDRRALAQFFDVPEAELGASEETSYPAPYPSARPYRSDWVEVPRLALGAAAGPGAVAGSETPFDTYRFSRNWLRDHGLEGGQLSAIRVTGDSMEPLLNDGDEILVDRAQRSFHEGVHVARVGDVLMVKQLALAGQGRVSLRSVNPAYPPFEVPLDELEIVGRVVWKSGRL